MFRAAVSLSLFSLKQCIKKQLLDEVFVISGIIKVSVSVISLSQNLIQEMVNILRLVLFAHFPQEKPVHEPHTLL